jgi:hypothetical protein
LENKYQGKGRARKSNNQLLATGPKNNPEYPLKVVVNTTKLASKQEENLEKTSTFYKG